MSFDFIPVDQIFLIALQLPLPEVARLCQTDQRFNEIVCLSNEFWKLRFQHDHGFIPTRSQNTDWRDLYKNYGRVFYLSGHYGYELPVPNRVQSISVGKIHTDMIDIKGNLYDVGKFTLTPDKIGDNVKFVSAGYNNTLAINEDNSVTEYGPGPNAGIIIRGIPSTHLQNSIPGHHRITPVNVFDNAQYVATSGWSSLFIDTDNNLWGSGRNIYGQLGLGHRNNVTDPIQIGIQAKLAYVVINRSLVIDMENNVLMSGEVYNNQSSSTFIPLMMDDQPFKAKSAALDNEYVIILIDMNDEVWEFSSGKFNRLGYQAKSVAVERYGTAILTLDGSVWVKMFREWKFRKILGLRAREIGVSDYFMIALTDEEYNVPYTTVEFGKNTFIIPFNTLIKEYSFMIKFEFKTIYQKLKQKPGNIIACFYGQDGNIYLVELQYNHQTRQIFPPLT